VRSQVTAFFLAESEQQHDTTDSLTASLIVPRRARLSLSAKESAEKEPASRLSLDCNQYTLCTETLSLGRDSLTRRGYGLPSEKQAETNFLSGGATLSITAKVCVSSMQHLLLVAYFDGTRVCIRVFPVML
jgi:hypothetical protein